MCSSRPRSPAIALRLGAWLAFRAPTDAMRPEPWAWQELHWSTKQKAIVYKALACRSLLGHRRAVVSVLGALYILCKGSNGCCLSLRWVEVFVKLAFVSAYFSSSVETKKNCCPKKPKKITFWQKNPVFCPEMTKFSKTRNLKSEKNFIDTCIDVFSNFLAILVEQYFFLPLIVQKKFGEKINFWRFFKNAVFNQKKIVTI